MMNIRSLLLLLFFAHHNVWTMDCSNGQLSNPTAAACKIKLVPESYTRIREWAIAETKRRAQTAAANAAIAEMPAQIIEKEEVTLPAPTAGSIQKPAATQMATRVRATSPAQQKQQAMKKKKKKKKSSTEDFDSLLEEFRQKDAQQRPKSPLRSSPKTNDQTITLDPEDDFLASDFLRRVQLETAKCLACNSIVCRTRHHSTRGGTVTYPACPDRNLEFTKLPSGIISLHDSQDEWKFVARPHGDSWKLTFNQGYAQRNAILKQLNTPASNDSSTEKEDSLEDYENDMYDWDDEPCDDDVTRGTRRIIARLTASRANEVILDAERKTLAKWLDSDNQRVIQYIKDGKTMFYIDVETEAIIAL